MARGERFFFRLWIVATIFWAVAIGMIPLFRPTTQPSIPSQKQSFERDPKCDSYKEEMEKKPSGFAAALWNMGNCEPEKVNKLSTPEDKPESLQSLLYAALILIAVPSTIILGIGSSLAWAIRGLRK